MGKSWPPNYIDVFSFRQEQLIKMRDDPNILMGAMKYYETRPVEFMCDWVDTYDPRNAGTSIPAKLPLVLFPKQVEFVHYLHQLVYYQENGLVEKSRDMGATWVGCGFSVWAWRFMKGSSIGWGSRKAQLVDKIGDPDSIFEKLRMIILGLPVEFMPEGFDEKEHLNFMKIVNPETNATITGEAGTNIGRGGRKTMYFKDESAHYAYPEKIEAALADNTNVQVDISSVNGVGTVFHRRRESGEIWEGNIIKGKTNVFIFDWSDHPNKDIEWYKKRRKKAVDEGLIHLFNQEVERDYASSVEGILVPPEWFNSAVDAHIKLEIDPLGRESAGLDVADEGKDKNAYAGKCGILLHKLRSWEKGDVGKTTRRAVAFKRKHIDVHYDCIGVGSGVKSEYNRLREEEIIDKSLKFIPWNAGGAVRNKEENVIKGDDQSPLNNDFYDNLTAQASWHLKTLFRNTHRAVTEGIEFKKEDLISISSNIPIKEREQLKKELAQIIMTTSTTTMKLKVVKSPEGMKSPNLADAVKMVYFPAEISSYSLDNI